MRDRRFEWLEGAYSDRGASLFWLPVMPTYDLPRPNPRLEQTVRRIGLSLSYVAGRAQRDGRDDA
jgi:hypothetical protein